MGGLDEEEDLPAAGLDEEEFLFDREEVNILVSFQFCFSCFNCSCKFMLCRAKAVITRSKSKSLPSKNHAKQYPSGVMLDAFPLFS